MKVFLVGLLFVVVFMGFTSALTPMIASYLVPVPEVVIKKADPDAVADALHQWFAAEPQVRFTQTQGLHQSDARGRVSWITFSVDAKTVSRYIYRNQLQQRPLNADILKAVFYEQEVPADWWQPASLTRETWFTGTAQGHEIGLIYNAEMAQGFLVARKRKAEK